MSHPVSPSLFLSFTHMVQADSIIRYSEKCQAHHIQHLALHAVGLDMLGPKFTRHAVFRCLQGHALLMYAADAYFTEMLSCAHSDTPQAVAA